MSDGRALFRPPHAALMAAMGTDVIVQRGADPAITVRAMVDLDQAVAGRYGKVAGSVARVSFLASEWMPERGDIVTIGDQARKVEAIEANDGIVVMAVLHG